MASSTFKFNGNIPNIVTFNGNDVKVLVYNNVTVWKKIITIDVPTTTSSFTYNGSSQSPVWSGYDSSKMTMGGSSSGTDAGTYTTTFTPNEGYAWPDESTTAKSVSWSIGQLSISGATVTLSNSLTYNGSAQTQNVSSVSISGLSATYSVSGNSQTNAGSYTLTCTGTGNYTGTQTASWSIAQKSISGATITLGSSLTYNGSSQTMSVSAVSISGLSATYSVSGNTGTNAGSYTLTCTGTGNFTGTATKSWSIAKASGYITLSATSGSVNKGSSITFTVNSYSGSLSVSSSSTSIATTSISGTTVTVNGVSSGSTATITVSVAASTNYNATSATYSAFVNYVWKRYYIQYNWGKYNCNATASGYSESTSWAYEGDTSIAFNGRSGLIQACTSAQVAGSYSFNTSSGAFSCSPTATITATGDQTYMGRYCTASNSTCTYCIPNTGNMYSYPLDLNTRSGSVYSSQWYMFIEGDYYSWTIPTTGLYMTCSESRSCWIYIKKHTATVSSYNYSQGSYITTVGSTNSSAYTSGARNSDGYWYVSTSSTNSGSQVDTVASSSSSAYADNGITGSYWCVKQ